MKTKLSKQEILERVGTMAQLAGIRPYVLREGHAGFFVIPYSIL